jgi:hypothetical protein
MVISVAYTSTGRCTCRATTEPPHCPVWVGTRDHLLTHIPYLAPHALPTPTNPTHAPTTRVLGAIWLFQWCGGGGWGGGGLPLCPHPRSESGYTHDVRVRERACSRSHSVGGGGVAEWERPHTRGSNIRERDMTMYYLTCWHLRLMAPVYDPSKTIGRCFHTQRSIVNSPHSRYVTAQHNLLYNLLLKSRTKTWSWQERAA